MTMNSLMNLYERFLRAEIKSEGTVNDYVKMSKKFLEYVNKDFKDISKLDIIEFANSNDNLSKNYKNSKLASIKSLFNFLMDMELIEKNPAKDIKKLALKDGDKKEKQSLNSEQITMMIRHCKNNRDKAIIEMLINTGLRISELINITIEDYNYALEHDGELKILGKGSKQRSVFLSDSLKEVIDDYLKTRKDSEYHNLFISNGGKKMSRNCISQTLKTIAKHTGCFTEEEIENLSNHSLRHTFVTQAFDSGVPLEMISKYVGHKNTQITYEIYLHQSKDAIKNEFSNFSLTN